jgi:hypothetical protein
LLNIYVWFDYFQCWLSWPSFAWHISVIGNYSWSLWVASNSPSLLVFEDLLDRFLVKIKSSLDVHPCLPVWVIIFLQHPVFACVRPHLFYIIPCLPVWDLIYFTISHVCLCESELFYNILCLPVWVKIILQHPVFAHVRHNPFYSIPCLPIGGVSLAECMSCP